MSGDEIESQFKEVYGYFILAFIISWCVWIIAPFISGGDPGTLFNICLLGAFGPALSAMFLSWKQNSFKLQMVTKKRLIIFLIIFLSTFFMLFILMLFNMLYTLNVICIIGSLLSCVIAGLIISGKFSKNEHMKSLLDKISGVKGKNIHLITAFSIPILTAMGGFIIYLLLGEPLPPDFNFLLLLLATSINFPIIFFFGGPLNEEPGWRAFATPRLQKRFNPLITGLIIGLIWTVWHAPLHFNGFYGDGLPGFLFRFIYNIPFGVLLTWYYNKSKGNLLGAVILHASTNVFSGMFFLLPLASIIGQVLLFIVSLIVIPLGKMWKRPTNQDAI